MDNWLALLQGLETLWWASLGFIGLAYGIALHRAIRHDESLLSEKQIIRRAMLAADIRAVRAGLGTCVLSFALLLVSYAPLPVLARRLLFPLPLVGILACTVYLLRQLWVNRQAIRRLVNDEITRLRDGNTPTS